MNRLQRILRSPWLAYGVFACAAAVFAVHFGSMRVARGEWDKIPLEEIIAGRSITPFQYRILVPWILGLAERFLLPLPGIGSVRSLAFLVEVASIFLAALAFRLYLGAVIRKPAAASLLSFLFLAILPFNYGPHNAWGFWLVYDIPSLLLFTLGLYLLYREMWLLYYPLFILATFNRETTCFLTIIFALAALAILPRVVFSAS